MSEKWEKFVWDRCCEGVAILWLVLFVALTAPRGKGAEPPRFVVENKTTQFTVVNKVSAAPALPTDPTTPAPPGYQWQKVGNEPWKLVAVPGVAAPRPFQPGFSSTPGTSANGVVLSSTQLAAPVPYRTLTPTGAPSAAMFGFTNGCPPSG